MYQEPIYAQPQEPLPREEGSIVLARGDHGRLRALVEGTDSSLREAVQILEEELDRAVVVDAADVPADVITLDSWARVLDLDSEQETLISPVLPSKANADAGRLSVLAPLGMAILGYRAGDTIEWCVPGGLRRLRVIAVMFQPEAYSRRSRAHAYDGVAVEAARAAR
jgi:regulator of nucleoside diphosphate kinase